MPDPISLVVVAAVVAAAGSSGGGGDGDDDDDKHCFITLSIEQGPTQKIIKPQMQRSCHY